VICDNNLSALPVEYQEHIIKRYQQGKVPFKEANSGFEPRYFDDFCYYRWKPLIRRGPWRFALDEMRELEDVQHMMRILKEEPARQKRVYVLIGNEDLQSRYERAMKVIEGGCEPHCQFVLPLNWLGDSTKVKLRYDWQSYQQGKDFCRYFNTWGWRSYPIWEYRPRINEPCPFAHLQPAIV
jgi:hypothetical protein